MHRTVTWRRRDIYDDTVERSVTLTWERFQSLTAARGRYAKRCCAYVQADRAGRAVRVGKASFGLVARYRGGTGHALDAAMHGSGNCVFVAAVAATLCSLVEATLIYGHAESLRYNLAGRGRRHRSGSGLCTGEMLRASTASDRADSKGISGGHGRRSNAPRGAREAEVWR
jgi:hypothetical protein